MTYWVDRAFPSPTFPIKVDLGRPLAVLFVVNNTAATVYLARGQASPGAGADATIPPYSPLPVYNWLKDTCYVGSDGVPLRANDSLVIYGTDDPGQSFPAVQLGQPNYYDKPTVAAVALNGGVFLTGAGLPTSSIQFWSYMVPANKKASIENLVLSIARTKAPGVATGTAHVYLQFSPAGGGLTTVIARCRVPEASGVTFDHVVLAHAGTIYAGDALTAWYASDGDATAEEYLEASARLSEFPA